jgi:transcription termination factor Rho
LRWPAIDVTRSGTCREELQQTPGAQRGLRLLRKVLGDRGPVEAMELLTNRLKRVAANAELLEGFPAAQRE